MKYNQYSFDKIKGLISAGARAAENGTTERELCERYSLPEFEFVQIGFHHPDFVPGEIREYYRIGEPRKDEMTGCYKPSWNSAEDRPEDGVSVVTTAWLNSFKSVFFNTTDEKIKSRGVWKIKGFALPSCGGDDETIICPLDWAEKTRIRTRAGLERAVKAAEKNS